MEVKFDEGWSRANNFVLVGNNGLWEKQETLLSSLDGTPEMMVDGQCAQQVTDSKGKHNIAMVKIDFL